MANFSVVAGPCVFSPGSLVPVWVAHAIWPGRVSSALVVLCAMLCEVALPKNTTHRGHGYEHTTMTRESKLAPQWRFANPFDLAISDDKAFDVV